jgi:hypothetical protein
MLETTTLYVRNTSADTLYVSSYPAFSPNEVRMVSLEDFKILLSNPHIVEDQGEHSETAPLKKDK